MSEETFVEFKELEIGDYFSDSNHQKFRKVPPLDTALPGQPHITFNAFHIQAHSLVSLDANNQYILIKRSTWNPNEKYGFALSIEESELENRLEFFMNYLETLESTLDGYDTNNSEEDEFYTSQDINEFVELLHNSFFVSLYSFLETQLNYECRTSQIADPKIQISLDDIHGTGINRAKTYLTKVLGCCFPFESDQYWGQIQLYSKIRNCIVHENGKMNNELIKRIDKRSNLFVERRFGDDYIILGDGFCREAIQIIFAFLMSLLYHRQADKVY